jgi:hypothetical protein
MIVVQIAVSDEQGEMSDIWVQLIWT